MPLLLLTIALDLDHPDQSTLINSPLAEPRDALALAAALAAVQQQLLALAAQPPSADPTASPPADPQSVPEAMV